MSGGYRPAYDEPTPPKDYAEGYGLDDAAETVTRSFWRGLGWSLGRMVAQALVGHRR